MNRITKPVSLLLLCLFGLVTTPVFSQCTTIGQTPATAFPVCGTTVFRQNTVPLCTNAASLVVPGCPAGGYTDRNPFYYRFTCFAAGTLAFLITPLAANEDYDWQLYDITGKVPNDIYTDPSTIVTGNWSGTYGATGANAGGINSIGCASEPVLNTPTFSAMPTLIVGHEYLLMISHFTDGQSGYDLSFGGGSAVITDPLQPAMVNVTPDCNGAKITLRLNKKVRCNTITGTGSEFSLLPAVTTVVSAVTDSCSFAFGFDEVTLTLATPLTSNVYELVINNGSDGNTLIDFCDNEIPQGSKIQFEYIIPQPILADSIGKPTCAPDSILVYYPKKIRCSTVSPNGGDFTVTGPTPVTVVGATGNCNNDLTDYVVVRFASPVYTIGTYTLSINPGIDGSPVFDLCGQPILPQTLNFTTADTVNADFSYVNAMGCRQDTLAFAHSGANDVNKWNWIFNNGTPVTTSTHSIIWPAKSSNTVQLIVDNGTCKDTTNATIDLDNEVKAIFSMPSIICPEDKLEVVNSSEGPIDSWTWNFDIAGTSSLKDPPPFLMPTLNREAYYTVKLVVYSNAVNCRDTARKTLTVLDHCLIAVPSAFTPNNDGLNDFFWPHNAIKADNYEFKVFNRWGQIVFQTRNWQTKWDGRVNGELQTTGVYVWMLRYTNRDNGNPVFQKGTVTLIR